MNISYRYVLYVIKQFCELGILTKEKGMGYTISDLGPVSIISVSDLSAAYDHAPLWWGQDKDSKHNPIFIIPPITVEEVFEEVGEIKPEYETVAYFGRVVFWSAPLKTFSRTRWSKIVGSSLYDSITFRNSNTGTKLLQLTKL
ncbi:DUF1697 domain-containing protein [Lachnoclostridium sp.]|uniref:DUF1697 domain-containing protein n=1 Tax=Lachnoclostridium sp. TaxID=2028282 RepID=UPI00289F362E|nr:DUF1697 domain-containing protein [Lachnoclostridium sp.]